MNIKRLKTKEETRLAAQKELSSFFSQHKNTPILFLSSGGSALELLDGLSISNRKDLITLGMLDERYSEKEGVNNFISLTKTKFFFNMLTEGVMLIDTSVRKGESLPDLAERYNASLRGWHTIHPEGVVIATVGIGKDGHVAGIMAGMKEEEFLKLFEDNKVWSVGYDTGKRGDERERVSVTFPYLRMIDHAVVYVVGNEKKKALSRAVAREGSLNETPARIIGEMKDASVFTDII